MQPFVTQFFISGFLTTLAFQAYLLKRRDKWMAREVFLGTVSIMAPIGMTILYFLNLE